MNAINKGVVMSDIIVKKDSYNRNWYNLDFELEGKTAVILECIELNHNQSFMSPCFFNYFLKQRQKLKETQEALDKAEKHIVEINNYIPSISSKALTTSEKLKIAVDALEFYNDSDTYLAPIYKPSSKKGAWFTKRILIDCGKTARQALEKIGVTDK